jgi:hypothetical protein
VDSAAGMLAGVDRAAMDNGAETRSLIHLLSLRVTSARIIIGLIHYFCLSK